jgi:hypothetical protein
MLKLGDISHSKAIRTPSAAALAVLKIIMEL